MLFFKQNKLLNASIICFSFLLFSILFLLLINIFQADVEVDTVNHFKDKNLYQLSDNLYSEKETAFFSNKDSYIKLNNFSNYLEDNKQFKYYNAVWQPIEVSDFRGDVIFDAYYETGNNQPAYEVNDKLYRAIKSIQLNSNVIEMNNLELKEGIFFKKEDYYYIAGSDEIPIILGSDYSDYYKTGDILDILYYQKKYTGKVIGIIKPFQKIMTIREPELLLDRYIILPLVKFEHNPPEVKGIFLKALLLSKINGNIISERSPLEIRRTLDEFSEHNEFTEYSVIGANSLKVDSIIKMTELNRNVLTITSIVLLFLLSIGSVMVLKKIIARNLECYKVLLISGVSIDQMKRTVKLVCVHQIVIGCILPLCGSILFIGWKMNILILHLLVIGFVIVVILSVSNRVINSFFDNLNIVQRLKG